MPVILNISSGPGAGKTIEFNRQDVLLIGRSTRCKCCIGDDSECSRVHLMLEVNPPICLIRDLGSTNGTYVNNNRITTATTIADGDQIRVGKTSITVQITPSNVRQQGNYQQPQQNNTPQQATTYNKCIRCNKQIDNSPVSVCPDCIDEMREIGEEFPGYKIIRQINNGAMGTIYLAVESKTGREVAIKTMLSLMLHDPIGIPLFLRECQVSLSLDHPNIVRYIKAGEYNGQLYLVMEFVDGQDAYSIFNRKGTFSTNEINSIAEKMLIALEYAHKEGFVHRDIKPQNIMVSENFNQIKLTDFGIAKNIRDAGMMNLTRPGQGRGTMLFMSPEQVTNSLNVDYRTDIFGLGATLYFLLSGQPVFNFPNTDDDGLLYREIISGNAVPLEQRDARIPKKLCNAINKAVERDPNKRFRNAAEMRQALI